MQALALEYGFTDVDGKQPRSLTLGRHKYLTDRVIRLRHINAIIKIMTSLSISKTIMRRFILGRQGLWPGRRWRGKDGAARLADIVSARGRAKVLFDFDYIWEVYKPASKRRWGYYTLPILYGDRLVARIDPKLDRSSDTLIINGLWLEDHISAKDDAFITALTRGLARFAHFVKAQRIDLSVVKPPALRKRLKID